MTTLKPSAAVLVVDVGGSHVKVCATSTDETKRWDSGRSLTPARLVDEVRRVTDGWPYDVVSIGYPGAAGANGPIADPPKLGPGWVGYDFHAAFGRPVRIVNDAALQALGGYAGGRMLFLGLGTGLGSAMIGDRVIIPLELGSLAYSDVETLADRLGKAGLERYGRAAWQHSIAAIIPRLRRAFSADYIVLGGGLVEQLEALPNDVRRGSNEDAIHGGVRLWEDWIEEHDVPHSHVWRVVW
jgi:polyphosphate glucokinase